MFLVHKNSLADNTFEVLSQYNNKCIITKDKFKNQWN